MDLPQNEHQDNRQENTQQNTNLSNQITVQAGNGMNAISPISANRLQGQKTVRFIPGKQILKPRTNVKAKERQFLTTIDGKVLVPISAHIGQSICPPHAGPSRATIVDRKRNEQRAQEIQTSNKHDRTKSKTAKSSEDKTKNKKSQIDAIDKPKLRFYFSQSDIEKSSYSVVKTISPNLELSESGRIIDIGTLFEGAVAAIFDSH